MIGNGTDDRKRRARRWRLIAWGGAAALILAPLAAMQFTDEVKWGPGDFGFAIAMVGGVGGAFELAVRVNGNKAYRAGAAIALAAAFLLIWINLAVGIIGSEDNPANWMYAGVLAVALLGAAIGRFEPAGMARAMFAAAIAQLLVAVAALAAGFGFTGPVTVFFGGLWLLSGALFRKAARERALAGRGGPARG